MWPRIAVTKNIGLSTFCNVYPTGSSDASVVVLVEASSNDMHTKGVSTVVEQEVTEKKRVKELLGGRQEVSVSGGYCKWPRWNPGVARGVPILHITNALMFCQHYLVPTASMFR
jgi:hypothetical protein